MTARWTSQEDIELTRLVGQKLDLTATAAALGRGLRATQKRIQRLRLTLRHGWTAGEDLELEVLWDTTLTCAQIADRIGHGPEGVYRRAYQLGLLGVPEGWELLSHAAVRTGLERRTLRRLVTLRAVRSRPGRGSVKPQHLVEIAAVDQAVTTYLAREPVERIARRAGKDPTRLRRALERAGVPRDANERGVGHPWRISDEDARKVIP